METESFHSARLGKLDFEQSSTERQSVSNIPLPDEMPTKKDFSHLPKEILKSTTVENLISQNEDLMARLKVTLRRLSALETENQRVIEEANKIKLSQSSVSDQIMVYKEKDSMWKNKIDQLEKEKEFQEEKALALSQRVQTLAAELTRHQKYHDRIRTQVKPYLTQLKEYSKTLEIKVEQLEKSGNKHEALLRDLRQQIIDVTNNSKYQVENSEKKAKELVNHYEEQVDKLSQEVTHLKETQELLEVRTTKLNTALERQDTLENEVINLRHSKEKLKGLLEAEVERQKERIQALTKQNQKLGVEHADLQVRVIESDEKLQRMEADKNQLQEQLEGLRFMWTAKNEENEKLKAAMAALEKLNLELSQKLNSMRKPD